MKTEYTLVSSLRRVPSWKTMDILEVCERKSSELKKIVQDLCMSIVWSYVNHPDWEIINQKTVAALLPLIQKKSTMKTRKSIVHFRMQFHAIFSDAGVIFPELIRTVNMFKVLTSSIPLRRKQVILHEFKSDDTSIKEFWFDYGWKSKFEELYGKRFSRWSAVTQSISYFNNHHSVEAWFRIYQVSYKRIYEICLTKEQMTKRKPGTKIRKNKRK